MAKGNGYITLKCFGKNVGKDETLEFYTKNMAAKIAKFFLVKIIKTQVKKK